MRYYPRVELDKSKITHVKTSNGSIVVSNIKLMIPIHWSSDLYEMHIGWSTFNFDSDNPEESNIIKIERIFNDIFNETGHQGRGNFIRGGLKSVDFSRIKELKQLEIERELFEDKKN